ncbi:unnamed protein product [Arctogadus glacialis]
MEKMENKMNVRDEEEASDSDRGTEAGSDQEADEDDRDAEGPEVPAGPNGPATEVNLALAPVHPTPTFTSTSPRG